MSRKYFETCLNIEELKREYKKLALQFHPDRPSGDLEQMKIINNLYEFYFNRLKNIHENIKTGENTTSKTESKETAYEFMEIINQLINFEGIEIKVIGTWIWVTGNTKPIKDTLKSLHFFYNGKRDITLWQRKPLEDVEKHRYSKESTEQIEKKYGCEKIVTRKAMTLN